ncbi:hypothetical protein P692DRAFT_201903961 [Suillus brevipes Sb2]|nr:hypothetical protein P692DRAFT_201903961 [Suillus brevipes Sb2]
MPYQTERQQAAESVLEMYIAALLAESHLLVDPMSSSSSGSSDSSSDDSSGESDSDLPTTSEVLLGVKFSRSEIFRAYVRVTPDCFDVLVSTLQDDPVFHNQSNLPQMPVDAQLAIALYRFGHYGNAISTKLVALWAGVGYGTVRFITQRVMKAICSDRFRRSALYWPTLDEKEEAKRWVEENSCPAWRDGWLMVDGTLVPLYARPAFYGNTWYDRKSNYSLNVQIVSTPDLRIIDYSVGLPGSQHDATAFSETRVCKEHNVLLDEEEWIFADTAYPLHSWCQAPYKK